MKFLIIFTSPELPDPSLLFLKILYQLLPMEFGKLKMLLQLWHQEVSHCICALSRLFFLLF